MNFVLFKPTDKSIFFVVAIYTAEDILISKSYVDDANLIPFLISYIFTYEPDWPYIIRLAEQSENAQ